MRRAAATLTVALLAGLTSCAQHDSPPPGAVSAPHDRVGPVEWAAATSGLDSVASVGVSPRLVTARGSRGGVEEVATWVRGQRRDRWRRTAQQIGLERLVAGPFPSQSDDSAVAVVGTTRRDQVVVGLDGSDGAVRWRHPLDGARVLGGAGDEIITLRGSGGSCTGSGISLSSGRVQWTRALDCRAHLDLDLVISGDSLISPGGEILLRTPGPVCGLAGGVVVWLDRCPDGDLRSATPHAVAVPGYGGPVPDFPAGAIVSVRDGVDGLLVVYGPGDGASGVTTRSWTATSGSEIEVASGQLAGELIDDPAGGVLLTASGRTVEVATRSGELVQTWHLPDAVPGSTPLSVEGTGSDYALLTGADGASGQVLVHVGPPPTS